MSPRTERKAEQPGGNLDRSSDQSAMRAAPVGEDAVVDALLSASRALVGLAARSLAELDSDVTLPQYRALVVVATRGPQRVVDIAAELAVAPSTGTRMCDRLVRKGLARRARSTTDRRAVRLSLTPSGRRLVEQVTRRRRDELARVVAALPSTTYEPLTAALRTFATAAGEPQEVEWWLGWTDGGG
jgi:DNA-binding MarR family transcriptional regulator